MLRKSKIIGFILFAVLIAVFSSMSFLTLFAKEKRQDSIVNLDYAGIIHEYSERGIMTGYYSTGYITVKNIDYNKNITVHYTYNNNDWFDVKAEYVNTSEDGTERWKFTTPVTRPSFHYYRFTCKFAIKYEVAGKTYWDNNNGNDYYICSTNVPVEKDIPYIMNELNVGLFDVKSYKKTTPVFDANANGNTENYDNIDNSDNNNNGNNIDNDNTDNSNNNNGRKNNANNSYVEEQYSFYGRILVKNLGFEKDVKVRYTEDNWKTFKETSAIFEQKYSNNVETWIFNVDNANSDTDIQFAVSYTCNGATYWDNNNSQNYSLKIAKQKQD